MKRRNPAKLPEEDLRRYDWAKATRGRLARRLDPVPQVAAGHSGADEPPFDDSNARRRGVRPLVLSAFRDLVIPRYAHCSSSFFVRGLASSFSPGAAPAARTCMKRCNTSNQNGAARDTAKMLTSNPPTLVTYGVRERLLWRPFDLIDLAGSRGVARTALSRNCSRCDGRASWALGQGRAGLDERRAAEKLRLLPRRG